MSIERLTILAGAALIALLWPLTLAFLWVTSTPVVVIPPPQQVQPGTVITPIQEPYGGCDEAYMYPDSPGADDCRALGWDIPR